MSKKSKLKKIKKDLKKIKLENKQFKAVFFEHIKPSIRQTKY